MVFHGSDGGGRDRSPGLLVAPSKETHFLLAAPVRGPQPCQNLGFNLVRLVPDFCPLGLNDNRVLSSAT